MDCEMYINKICKEKIESLSAHKVEKYFNELIKLMPNGGKLYKYRSFESKDINLYLEALDQKYLWIPSASKMPDIMDSRLNFKLESDLNELEKYVRENPYIFFVALYKNTDVIKEIDLKKNKNMMDDYIKNIDLDNGEIKIASAVATLAKYGIKPKDARDKIEQVNEYIKTTIESKKDYIIEMLNDLIGISDRLRENINIYSMCEKYDNNFLWDVYAEKDGFCIEYDFNKVKSMPINIKRDLLLTLKVNYRENLKRFSIFKFIKKMVDGDMDKKYIYDQQKLVIEQVFSKGMDYCSEQEWRIMQYKKTNKMYIDLVSSIIIDEKGLNQEKAKDLCAIAKDKSYKLIVRKFNKYNSEYVYDYI